jgi:hypothetical protein
VVWIVLTLLAVSAVVIAITALVGSDSGSDPEPNETVEVRSSEASQTEQEDSDPVGLGQRAGEPDAGGAGTIRDKPLENAPRPPSSPAPAAPVVAGGSAGVTTFACKTDIGVEDPSCGDVYEANGLRVEAHCSASGLAALATVPHAVMTAETIDAEGESFGSITDSVVNRGFTLTSEKNPASSGTVTFTPPDSVKVITVDFSATYSPGAPQGDCVFLGTITEH